MNSKFARRMEIEAEKIAEPFQDYIYGVRCWSSAVRLFGQGAERAFIGTNPGGDEKDHRHEKRIGYQQMPYLNPNFNAWLDEAWRNSPTGESNNQRSVRHLFKAMYGDAWEKTLRNTACFEVAPFRAPKASELPSEAWSAAMPWFQQVLEHVKPRLIICNGNGEDRSPWSVLSELYGIDYGKTTRIGKASAYMKEGNIQSGKLQGVKVIGIPHLSGAKYNHNLLFAKLQKLRPFV